MKVIETEYKGTKYRSRTEARWAVFMDAVHFPFVYEPEGFDLGSDGWYIPDFWLPSIDKFMEIKPEIVPPGRTSPVEALCRSTQKDVITFCGMPTMPDLAGDCREDGYLAVWCEPEELYPEGYIGEDTHYWFCCCPYCKRVGIEFNGRSDRIGCDCPKSVHGDKGYNYDDPVLQKAYYEARNAFRF